MNKQEVLKELTIDDNYYGDFGKKYLSNSDISTLLTNPLALGQKQANRPAFLVGGYFHTAILEPEKLKNFKIVEATTRNTKVYKEISDGEMCLLKHEVDQIELMTEKMLDNLVCADLIRSGNVEYEQPGITELEGQLWKGKADIVNHDEKLIIDLKTTADITKFKYSASKYNYDSQAYIYSKMFGYEFIFIVVDKKTRQLGLFDCSDQFLQSGQNKVAKAVQAYNEFFVNGEGDFSQYYISKTL